MKKIVSLLLIFCMAFSVVACKKADDSDTAEENTATVEDTTPAEDTTPVEDTNPAPVAPANLETAVWDGYNTISFKEYLQTSLGTMADGAYEVLITTEDGWGKSENLTADILEANKKAVTFKIVFDYAEGDDIEHYFFMAYHDGKLETKGVYSTYGTQGSNESDASHAESMLTELKEYIG